MTDASKPTSARDTVFISLAMPEDTDFGVWLSIQLARQGYCVWSEATKLVGGERFWNDIQDALNTSAAKMIYVVSRASLRKDGVQNELDHARAIATKRLNISVEKFIQAIVLDDLEPFQELPIQLSGRNAIFFSNSWANGLERLLKVLERDKIPKTTGDPDQLSAWVRDKFADGRRPLQQTSTVATNLCPISSFPEDIWFYEFKARMDLGKPDAIRSQLPWPNFVHGRLLGTFATPHEVLAIMPPELGVSLRGKASTLEFLAKGAQDPVVDRRSARNFVTSITREAWDRLCEGRGLVPMRKSATSVGWFYPADGGKARACRFTELDGRTRNKALHGVKTKKLEGGDRQVAMHWHFSPTARISVADDAFITLVPHVAFTTNGRTLLGDADKAHRMRRSFCKSWFNEQWRTLHLAYIASLVSDTGDVELPVSPGEAIRVSAKPDLYESPVTFDPPPVRKRGAADVDANVQGPDQADDVPDDDVDPGSADAVDDWDEEDEE